MKLPRPIVWMLCTTSATMTLGVSAWYWFVWPELTTRHFVRLVGNGRFDEANQLLLAPTRWATWPDGETALEGERGAFPLMTDGWQQIFREPLELHPRSVADVILGARTFGLNPARFLYSIEFTAVRGRIVYRWVEWKG